MTGRFIIDASVTLAWCFADENSALADSALDALADHDAIVPVIWTLEVANVLLVAERKGRITRTASEQFLALLEKLPITVDIARAHTISATILSLGREHGLSSYDAAYLELAMREGLPLATTDAALLHAMSVVGVALFAPVTA